MKSKLFFSIQLLAIALMTGCSSVTKFEPLQDVSIPETWSEASGVSIQKDEPWWKEFNDPLLDTLIDQALQTNSDFAVAVIRVRRARLQAGLADTNLTPAVVIGANAGITKTLDPETTTKSSGVTSSISYEIDLWGKLANLREAANLELEATEDDCHVFALSLLGTTTRLYWQVAYLNRLLKLSDSDIESAEKARTLTRARFDAGAVSDLNNVQAELNLYNQQALRSQLVQQRVEARHALALLLNKPPQSDVPDPAGLPDAPMPPVAAGIPADVLSRRPDMHAAELRLRGALVNVEIARTSFYPTFSLTGTLGTVSTELTNLSQNPVATLGAGLSLPFVQWNTTQLTIAVSKSQYEEAVVNYRQRLYTALTEVEDSLSARTQLQAQEVKLNFAKTQALRAERIAHTRFDEGFTDILQWLDAQASLRSAERAFILNRLNQLNNQVNLYKALGLGASSNLVQCRHNPKG